VYHVIRVQLGKAVLGTGPFAYKSMGMFAVGLLGICGGQLFKLQKLRASEIDSLRSVNEVHSLLIELNARAADDPRSLTLNGAVHTVVANVKAEIPADVVAVLIRDAVVFGIDRQWQVAAVEGLMLPPMIPELQLPPGARLAEQQFATLRWPAQPGSEGLDRKATSGLYAPLWGRTDLLGMVILERRGPLPFSDADVAALDTIARRAGLVIENTQWFARLRQLGAEEERERIARELHDRIGQSLASVGLAVDRLALTMPPEVDGVRQELESVAQDVRGVTRQIRDKLTDLRTSPSASVSLAAVLEDFTERVAVRSNLQVSFDHRPVSPLSPAEEHEVWRIAQEAIINAERHAGAKSLRVYWGEEAGWRLLTVSDDGKGIMGTAPPRRDAYGLIGMRERAEVIGASLRIDTAPGRGTTVSLRLKGAHT
jgi:signal transduction histidine kinase